MLLSLINFQYLFDAYPPRIKQGTFLTVIVLSLVFLAIAIVLKYLLSKDTKFKTKIDKYQKEFYIKLINILFTSGLINLFLITFRKLRVPYFQIRFVLILWWATISIWLITILQYQLTKVPELREKDKKRREFEKYIK
jgi:steroid 5-alpha reductase family enzyme